MRTPDSISREAKVAVHTAPPAQVPPDYDRYAAHDDRGYAWVALRGCFC
jgi:hypothetical protein